GRAGVGGQSGQVGHGFVFLGWVGAFGCPAENTPRPFKTGTCCSDPLVVVGPVLRSAPTVDADHGQDLHVGHTGVDGAGGGGSAGVGACLPPQTLGGVVTPVQDHLELTVVQWPGTYRCRDAHVAGVAVAVTENPGVGDGE